LKKDFNPQDWISMASAARLRGVSRAAIADLVRRGRLISCEVGDKRLVNKSEVLAFKPKPIGRPLKKVFVTKSSQKKHSKREVEKDEHGL
jgi:excisionase family DNA binding protein